MTIKGMWLCTCGASGGKGSKKPVKVCSEGICVKCGYYAYFKPYTYYLDGRFRTDGRTCSYMRNKRLVDNHRIKAYLKEYK
jgi:hypothetical protein